MVERKDKLENVGSRKDSLALQDQRLILLREGD
jgi:hypothetical protein